MNEVKPSNQKLFWYVAPPKDNQRISKFEQKILDIVKESGSVSMNDISVKLMPNVDMDSKKLPFMVRTKTALTFVRIANALLTLAKMDCVKIIR